MESAEGLEGERSNVEISLALTSARLADAGFRHGFSTRGGGADVARLAPFVGSDPKATYQVHQVHGARVVRGAGDVARVQAEEADALVAWEASSAAPLPAVGIRVADCVPVLVGDRATGAVAAIHAGWRGLVAGVIGAAVDTLRGEAGARADSMVAAIGPSIGPCCFEVGREVADAIAAACADDAAAGSVVVRRAGDKAFVDLRLAARLRLRSLGLRDGQIDDVPGCTRCDAARFFSYRREGAAAGRHLALIVARSPA